MNKKSLIEEFNIKTVQPSYKHLTDYEVFKDKELLDSFRSKIIEKFIDQFAEEENITDLIEQAINTVTDGYDLSNIQRASLRHLIESEVLGYGPLQELIDDPNITEIMVNSPNEIYIESEGILSKDESVSFINENHIKRILEKMLNDVGKHLDNDSLLIDTRLKTNARLEAILPPLSKSGPILTIHKYQKEVIGIDELIRYGSLTPYMATFLENTVKARGNILICGNIGSGSTTLLSILGNYIDDKERIITIEDVAELNLKKPHVINLETNADISLKSLIKSSLRMRPDRLIIGEFLGDEALEMLQIMNFGQDGTMATIRANGAVDALNRLERIALNAEANLSIKHIREYIVKAIDLVVHIERLADGKRKILSIGEVNLGDNQLEYHEIFAFHQELNSFNNEVRGEYILYDDKLPRIVNKMHQKGINDVDIMFLKRKK